MQLKTWITYVLLVHLSFHSNSAMAYIDFLSVEADHTMSAD